MALCKKFGLSPLQALEDDGGLGLGGGNGVTGLTTLPSSLFLTDEATVEPEFSLLVTPSLQSKTPAKLLQVYSGAAPAATRMDLLGLCRSLLR